MTTTTKKTRVDKKTARGKVAAPPKRGKVERYTVAIDDLVIVIERSGKGMYIVTCPFDPELMTQGRTLDEAVFMAQDARRTLAEARARRSTAGAKS